MNFLPAEPQGIMVNDASVNIGVHVTFQTSQSVQSLSLVQLFVTPFGLQLAQLPCQSPTPGVGQTHVHRVGDAIQPSYLLSSPFPTAFNLSQHQGLFQ